jgi:adenine-specific DNA-methyltransferase
MPTLDWIGKKAVLNHHNEVPFHLLRCNPELSVGEASGNLLVQGDNLLALKALLPYYTGQVKCIYIDPPYNTGNQGWVYNDSVNSPEIREWLGKVVGGEADDLSRHDKWLCMMYPRLTLLRKMLREDGVLWMSIDDNEEYHAKLLLNEIFGPRNFVGVIVWKNATDNNPTNITTEHEYVICYAKDTSKLPKEWKSSTLPIKERLMELGREFIEQYTEQKQRQAAYTKWYRQNRPYIWPFQDYKFIDEGGIYTGSRSVHNPGKEGYRYDVIHPNGKPCNQPLMGYRFPNETMQRLLVEKRILFGDDETKLIELKLYVKDYRAKLSSLFELDGRVGTNEIKDLFPENRRPFDFPKPTELIEELLSFTVREDDLILDSFAGSGTTGHAVLNLNKLDGGSRRFILVEMDKNIAQNITAQRVERVIKKAHTNTGFRFCELGPTLFDSYGQIRPDVSFLDLARHVYLTESGQPLPADVKECALLGVSNETAVYLLYNGALRDSGNVLTPQTLAELPPYDGPKTVYADGCKIGRERLREMNVTFKQIPYQIKVK